MPRLFAYVPQKGGVADDAAAELLAAARKIDAGAAVTAIVTGFGADLDAVCETVRAIYPEVWKAGAEALAYPNAEIVRRALVNLIPAGSVVLVPHAHLGTDLSPGLSVKMNAAYAADVVDIEALAGGSLLKMSRQEFGGQVNAHVWCDVSGGAVINVRPGAFQAETGGNANGLVVDKSAGLGALDAKRRYLETIPAETGDVDITRHAVLVSVGRGIGDAENLPIAEELAAALGGAVSCSRPVVDAKWLEKSRQVGSSGKTVKPKVYLACGISGSFQHLAGIKGNPFLVAINKNPKAPIFRVADAGIVADLLEFLPAFTEKVKELR